jgi:hypothetical protein
LQSRNEPFALREFDYNAWNEAPLQTDWFDYADHVVLSAEAERDPKAFIRSRLKARHGLHR